MLYDEMRRDGNEGDIFLFNNMSLLGRILDFIVSNRWDLIIMEKKIFAE